MSVEEPTLAVGWERVALQDVAETSSGGTPSRKNPAYYEGGEIPWVKIGDLNDGVVRDTEVSITEEGLANSSAKLLPAGTLLLAMYGASIGKLGVLGMPAATNQAICAILPSEQLGMRFLYWFLRAERRNLVDMGRGGAQPNIGQGDIKELILPLPRREEQDHIVHEVDAIEENVQLGADCLSRAIAEVERYRRAVAATCFDTGASVAPLDDVASVQSGIAKGRPQADGVLDMPYIRTANVQAGYLDLQVIKTLAVSAEQREKHLLRPNDVLILEGGDADKVGRGWIWEGQVEGCLHQNHVFSVRPEPTRLLPRYLAYFVNAPQARKYFLRVAKQTVNLASINKANLKALPVPLPSLEEQQRVVDTLDRQLAAADAMVAGLRSQLDLAAQLRRAMLASAMRGDLSRQPSPHGDEAINSHAVPVGG